MGSCLSLPPLKAQPAALIAAAPWAAHTKCVSQVDNSDHLSEEYSRFLNGVLEAHYTIFPRKVYPSPILGTSVN